MSEFQEAVNLGFLVDDNGLVSLTESGLTYAQCVWWESLNEVDRVCVAIYILANFKAKEKNISKV